MIALMGFIANFSVGNCGYPMGGSLEFAMSIEKRYLELGGRIQYRSKVEKLIIENDTAKGVLLADGTEHRASRVISAADGRWTAYDLLGGKYLDEDTANRYASLPVYPSCVYITLGIDSDLSAYPHGTYYKLDEPFELAGKPQNWMGIQHYCYDKTLTKDNKSIVNVMMLTEYGYWKNLYGDRARYTAEKQRLSDIVIAEVEKHYQVQRGQIEVVDVATPVTYERYTGTWQGSFMGWKPSVDAPRTPKKKTLPHLSGFYMAGQWMEYTGGLSAAAKSGRDVIYILCKEDGHPIQ